MRLCAVLCSSASRGDPIMVAATGWMYGFCENRNFDMEI